MKKFKIALLTLMFLGTLTSVNAQFGVKLRNFIVETSNYLRPTPWTVGLGWNIVDDNGTPWKKIFDAGNSWQIAPFPTSLRGEKDMTKGWSVMLNINFNQYKAGKLVNSDLPATSSSLFMSYDVNAKYNFSHLFDFSSKVFKLPEKLLDVYMASGFGYTYRNTAKVSGAATYNIGFGMTAIFYKGWGMNLEAMSKFGLKGPIFKTPSNYLQYNFGAVYRFKQGPRKLGRRNGLRKRYYIKSNL